MAFCPNCGTQAGSAAFCPNCGTSLGTSGGGPSYSSLPGSAGLSTNLAAALCYVAGILSGVIFLVLQPYSRDRNVRFHAFQSIFFSLAWILFGYVIDVVAHPIRLFLLPIYQLFFFIIYIFLIVSAYQGKRVVLPVIGDLAAKQA